MLLDWWLIVSKDGKHHKGSPKGLVVPWLSWPQTLAHVDWVWGRNRKGCGGGGRSSYGHTARSHDQRKNSSTPPVAAIPPLYVGALVSGDTLSRALDVFLSLIQLSVEST